MSDSQLYSRLLLPKGHGYPLFHPQPYDDLWEIRKTGTEIGDVGVVKDGCFDVIFNICCAADHQINRRFDRGLPEGFEQLQLSPGDLAPHASYHPPGADISNTRITKRRLDIDASVENNVFLPVGAGAVVEISATAKETALLLLPDGASRCDLRPLQVFKDYALKHARNWYAFVNGRLGWMVEAGDLYLITGVDKSSTWSVLAMENRSEDLHLSLKLKAAQLASAGGSCRWEWENNSSFANSGPRREPGFTEEQPKKDQTVFLRGFKVAVRSSPWTRSAKALSIVDSKPSNILSKGGFIPFSQPRSGSAGNVFRGSGSSSGRGGASNEDESADFFPSHHQAYHPANAINEYLLNSSPGANVAVTHDNEWASVLSADEKLPGNIELIERISRRYRTHTTSDGVWLQDYGEIVPIAPTDTPVHEELPGARRTPMPEQPPAAPVPKKKALLIGISHTESGTHAPQAGAHEDVLSMRKLLIEQYGYVPADIMILVDSDEGSQPTRVNILRAIDDLVDGARKEDRFFFYYCGRTSPVHNMSNSEEDGLDECLVPLDGEHKIKDTELSLHLVDPLPIGSSLVAVFDSCSSASLLDLAHFRCNRVYVPWIYKTRRRRDEIWDAVVRRNALTHPLRPLTPPTTDKVPIKNILKALSFNSPHSLGEDQQAEGRSPGSWLDTKAEAPSRESPEPIERWLCTGWCRPAEPEHETAEVISLAWCNDYQQSWQDAHRVSMTRELVRILEHDPHPKLQTLGMGLSHALHRMLKLAMEKSTEVYTDSYQSPELASPQPLDMARPWTM